MNIQAEISLYPLAEKEYGERITGFIEILQEQGLDITPGPMSTIISGSVKDVFDAIARAYSEDIDKGLSLITIKASNACPAV